MISKNIALTGATGYVGGRLLNLLLKNDYNLRCIARNPDYLKPKLTGKVEIVKGDLLDKESIRIALKDIDVAFYLVHSMGSKTDFEQIDRIAAENFADSARENGLKKIIYLGGLFEDGENLSPHLRSRQEVGNILRNSGIPVIEFRASIIIGSGSLSFEMIRALVERLPVMVTPKWVRIPAQPIFIEDVLRYLYLAIELNINENKIFEIGGPEVVSYSDLMKEYAKIRGLKLYMIPVPILTLRLSGLWLGLVTPIYARVGKKLIDSIKHPTIVRDHSIKNYIDFKPIPIKEAIELSLKNEDLDFSETSWSDSISATIGSRKLKTMRLGNRLVDIHTIKVKAPKDRAFSVIEKIGGKNGWYSLNFLWYIRGFIDLLVGGVGLRRGRRDPNMLVVGDVLDFWRVEVIERPNRLLLRAEMKLPGNAWLEFNLSESDSETLIKQIAIFDPSGLSGIIYWYSMYPFHQFVFKGMLKKIASLSEEQN